MILQLQQYWITRGCLLWQPQNTEVGAGTMNPATFLRVLGPEPWNVAYVEPSVRADDSRYGDNPNRLQMHTQYQVILKPDPGNPQELYLGSLEAIGIDLQKHDVRFVEDNWESPALGAWGLGWEVWLDGLEITQFTYFQQAGGFMLDPVAVELTYGLERIIMALQGVDHFKKIAFAPGITYNEVLGQNEYEMSVYNLDAADVDRAAQMFNLYEAEALMLLEKGLPIPAYSYILKTSHTFNLLDARGAIGVTERARYFARMRKLAQAVAKLWHAKREEQAHPLGKVTIPALAIPPQPAWRLDAPQPFVLEIGSEELPAADVTLAVAQLRAQLPKFLDKWRIAYRAIEVAGTPRRIVAIVADMTAKQPDEDRLLKGPLAQVAFDAEGKPTKAASGFARSRGVDVNALERRAIDGKEYVVAQVREIGQPTGAVLTEALPELIASITFGKSMRWNWTNTAYSRPLRWIVALLGKQVVPFTYAGLISGRDSYGLRNAAQPKFEIPDAFDYDNILGKQGIVLRSDYRQETIWEQAQALAATVNGRIPESARENLLPEVANLVEQPTPLLGVFEEKYLELPQEILVTVMRKHQRYFPVEDQTGMLLPRFVTVANGAVDPDVSRAGNEAVLRARYADAAFFWRHDLAHPLESFRPALAGLIFQGKLGSMLDKTVRLEKLAATFAQLLALSDAETAIAKRATALAKADLVTHMVIEMTSLAGVMGREYARRSGEPEAVAQAIFEHALPRYAGDLLPTSKPGIAIGLADRLDSLVGLFAIGLAPTATADPFALRRAALGLLQILIERGLELDLTAAIHAVATVQPVPVSPEIEANVLEFIRRRLKQWLTERGERNDLLQAVAAMRGQNPALAVQTLRELAQLVKTERFQRVLTAYLRPARIVRDHKVTGEIQPGLFEHAEEHALWQTYQEVRPQIQPEVSISSFMAAFEPLVEPINRFFDKVFVMVEQEAIRQNRLLLLQAIADLQAGIADLTEIRDV